MPELNPEILKWARETSGMTLGEAASVLGIANVERLAALEAGTERLSRPLLLKMSKKYHRSLLTFYLAVPPKRGDRGQDFRTLPPDRSVEDEAALDALIRDLKTRQGLVRSLMEDEEEAAHLKFIGSRRMGDGVGSVVQSIQETLSTDSRDYRSQKSYDAAFTFLRGRAEAAGVFVLVVGDLGSHHSAIPVETFRGFAIADSIAPFVVINPQDARPAWSFTLLHEMAHLWLGTTGVSGVSGEKDIEKFCNDVAGEFLLPMEELRTLAVSDATSLGDAIDLIARFSRERLVSRAMVGYRLLRTNHITWGTWRALDKAFHEMWLRERERHKDQQEMESGPSYYVVRRHRIGNAMLGLVSRNVRAGTLSAVRAAKILGVKPRSVHPLLADFPRMSPSSPDSHGGP